MILIIPFVFCVELIALTTNTFFVKSFVGVHFICVAFGIWEASMTPEDVEGMGSVLSESSWKLTAISHKRSLSLFANSTPLSESFCNCFNTCQSEKKKCLFSLLIVQQEAENCIKLPKNILKIQTFALQTDYRQSPTIFESLWPGLLSVTLTQENQVHVYWVTHTVWMIIGTGSLPSCWQSWTMAIYLPVDSCHLWQQQSSTVSLKKPKSFCQIRKYQLCALNMYKSEKYWAIWPLSTYLTIVKCFKLIG